MKKRNVILIVCLCIGMLCLFTGCQQKSTSEAVSGIDVKSGETQYPITVTDDLGNVVTIEKEPQRIISLSPANTETIFAIGQGDKLVGRTEYCNYPEEALTVASIGDYNAPNLEKIIQLEPDLILASEFVSDEIYQQLEVTGAKILVFAPASVEGIMNNIIMTGEVTNANDQTAIVVEKMATDRQDIIEQAKTAEVQKSVFIDVGDFFSAGQGSMLNSILENINAKNIASDSNTPWPQLTTEEIIASNPDVYISLYSTPEEVKAVPGFEAITAVKDNAIGYYAFLTPESDLVQRPGPRIVEGMALLAHDVYPDIFK
jgi:iron complex transport system substrate-binding protein